MPFLSRYFCLSLLLIVGKYLLFLVFFIPSWHLWAQPLHLLTLILFTWVNFVFGLGCADVCTGVVVVACVLLVCIIPKKLSILCNIIIFVFGYSLNISLRYAWLVLWPVSHWQVLWFLVFCQVRLGNTIWFRCLQLV